MEVRARYVLVGLFLLAVIAAGFVFVYWLNNVGGLGERTSYRVRFEHTVSGLLLGSAVQFNGIRVGEVTDLQLNPDDPRQVRVTIAVASDTPIRTDTTVRLAFGGLTGVPEIALFGGTSGAPMLEPPADGGPPLLIADEDVTQDWTETAREAFMRIDRILAENAEALKSTLDNFDTFSKALALNADSVENILAGLERLAGARGGSPGSVYFELTPPVIDVEAIPEGQLVVRHPTAPLQHQTARFLLKDEAGESVVFQDAQWSDTVPKIVQSTIIRAFENADYLRVADDLQGLASDYALLIDIRAFRLVGSQATFAEVDFTAKLSDSFGTVLSSRRFQARASLPAMAAADAAGALDQAFGEIIVELVPWALAAM